MTSLPTMPSITAGMSPRDILQACAGFYECPKDAAGKRLGPMVGYAGRDETGRQYVGDVYANFAKIEQWPALMSEFVAVPLLAKVRAALANHRLAFCGMPEGGKSLGEELARLTKSRYVYPDKLVLALKTEVSKERTELRMKRHDLYPGEDIIIVEDVCNNFSTTGQFITEAEAAGAKIAGIACFLNRSASHPTVFVVNDTKGGMTTYPVISLWGEPMTEYKQSEPRIELELTSKNVVFDPKKDWATLEAAMREHPE